MNARYRAELIVALDKEQKWLQKAGRHYERRWWVQEMRQALGIPMSFLMDELKAKRAALYRAEAREGSGDITINELEVLAEAMECKLVYAIVPKRGTVAEAAVDRERNPKKTRTEREKEHREYLEWYEAELRRRGVTDPDLDEDEEDEEPEDEDGEMEEEEEEPVRRRAHSPGVQRLLEAIAGQAAADSRAKLEELARLRESEGAG